jgi:hypothetical protein
MLLIFDAVLHALRVHPGALKEPAPPDLCSGVGIGSAIGIAIGFDPDSGPDASDSGGIFGIETPERKMDWT